MSTLLDTNILTRSVYPADPQHQLAVDAVASLRQKNEQLHIAPQNVYELWVVCTRPVAQNGLGMTSVQVDAEITQLERLFALLNDTPDIFPEWRRIEVAVDGILAELVDAFDNPTAKSSEAPSQPEPES